METTFEIKRSTAIYLVVFLVVCFIANFVAFYILVKNSNGLLQGCFFSSNSNRFRSKAEIHLILILFFFLHTDELKDRTKKIRNEFQSNLVDWNSTISQKVVEIDVQRPEANFIYEINDVQAFLNSKKSRGSEFFFCRSMRFYIELKYAYFEGDEYFGVCLKCHNPSDTFDYSMATSYEFRLVNWLGKEDKIEKFNFNFVRNLDDTHGNTKFLPITVLTNPSNGWVRDDKLRLKVNLKCERFFRTHS